MFVSHTCGFYKHTDGCIEYHWFLFHSSLYPSKWIIPLYSAFNFSRMIATVLHNINRSVSIGISMYLLHTSVIEYVRNKIKKIEWKGKYSHRHEFYRHIVCHHQLHVHTWPLTSRLCPISIVLLLLIMCSFIYVLSFSELTILENSQFS